jgi:hypothetical protein
MAALACSYVSDILHIQTDAVEEARLAWEAAHFPVKRIPYAGERSFLKFDQRRRSVWHRTGSRQPGALARACLSFSDFQRGVHIEQHATTDEMRLKFTPEFSKDDGQLWLVIAQESWDYCRYSSSGLKEFYGDTERVPNGFVLNREALEALCRKATDRLRASENITFNTYRHVEWLDAHGGYVRLRDEITRRAWREYKDAHTIANELGMTWAAVRQMLCRMCESARKLGLPTFERHHSCIHKFVREYDAPHVHPNQIPRGRRRRKDGHFLCQYRKPKQ